MKEHYKQQEEQTKTEVKLAEDKQFCTKGSTIRVLTEEESEFAVGGNIENPGSEDNHLKSHA